MADEARPTFPVMPSKNWWLLRERFHNSIPSTVTKSYLQTVLGVSDGTAKITLANLRTLGLIDSEGKVTDRGEKWRHDDTYAQVCAEIANSVYPDELRSAISDPVADRDKAESWFARTSRVGKVSSQQMASLFQIVMEADTTKKPELTQNTTKKTPVKKPSTDGKPTAKATKTTDSSQVKEAPKDIEAKQEALTNTPPIGRSENLTSLHIDVQIHISHEASPEQIDAIFASMAKHLYKQDAR